METARDVSLFIWGMIIGSVIGVASAFGVFYTEHPAQAGPKLQITQDGEYLVYPTEVMRVVDGDTIDLRFKIWPDLIKDARVRLLGIDAPEVRGESRPSGLQATEYLKSRLDGAQVYIKTDGAPDKYGRLLGIILIDAVEGKIDINKEMLEKGIVQPYN